MDNSTIIFVVTLAAAFLVLRWLIKPIPQSVPDEFNIPDPLAQPRELRRTQRQHVTESMIEVVQAIAPHLLVSQIRHSLQQTGSVELTVNEYMLAGTLPYPPGESAPVAVPEEPERKKPTGPTKNLLEKYNVDVNAAPLETPVDQPWGSTSTERLDLLQRRREEMILKARSRIASEKA